MPDLWHVDLDDFLQAVIEFRLGYPNMKWRNVYKVSRVELRLCFSEWFLY